MAKIAEADAVLVFSCGVGVQTISQMLEDKPVYACCDTIELPGFQGVTPLEYDCGQCGECFLNLTGGICPITACSKSLVNGPCGGTKNGKCEVNPAMDWMFCAAPPKCTISIPTRLPSPPKNLNNQECIEL